MVDHNTDDKPCVITGYLHCILQAQHDVMDRLRVAKTSAPPPPPSTGYGQSYGSTPAYGSQYGSQARGGFGQGAPGQE